MKYNHLFASDDGESHWRTLDVSLSEKSFAPPAKAIEISDPEPAKSMLFLRLTSGWDEPVHPTPKAQMLICLSGLVEVTASDGGKRSIGPGDVWRMEDKSGKGHHTKVTSAEDFTAVIVQFD